MLKLLNTLGKAKILKDCDIKRHRLVAIAFTRSGRIIAIDTNRRGSGAISDFSFHAEEFLIRRLHKIKARERFGDISILVARWGRGPGWTLARPCEGCQALMARYGIKTVEYTDYGGKVIKGL